MKNSLIFIILTVTSFNIKASELYFIGGHPRMDIMNQFPVNLYRYISPDSTFVTEIVNSSLAVSDILSYSHLNEVIIFAHDLIRHEDYFYSLSMNNPQSINKIEITESGYSFMRPFMVNKNDRLVCMLDYYGHTSTPKQLYRGLELDGLTKVECREKDQINMYVVGSPAGAVGSSDHFRLAVNENNELFVKRKQLLSTGIFLPKGNQFSTDEIIGLYINNERFMMISSRALRKKHDKGNMHTDIWIYKKDTEKWDKVNIPGIPTFYRGFGNWMAGTITDRTQGKNMNKVTVEKKELPGKAKRDQKLKKTGTPVDYRYDTYEIYAPGQLLLYNISTKKKITINTQQGDCEVLLIEGDTLYYRIYDAIYQAAIINGKIEKEKLLLQEDYVPDIHWAFVRNPKLNQRP